MDGYLIKPIDVDTLIATIESTGDRRRRGRNAITPLATGSPDDSQEPIADLSATMKRLGGDEKLLEQFVEVFHEDTPTLLQQLESAVAEDDCVKVARTAHTLKGLVSNFDAALVVKQATALEAAAKRHDLSGAEGIMNRLSASVSRLGQYLNSYQ